MHSDPQHSDLYFISLAIATSLFHAAANSELQKRSRDIVQAIVLLSAIVSMLCFGVAGNSVWIVEHIFGAEFGESAPVFMIYAHVPFWLQRILLNRLCLVKIGMIELVDSYSNRCIGRFECMVCATIWSGRGWRCCCHGIRFG